MPITNIDTLEQHEENLKLEYLVNFAKLHHCNDNVIKIMKNKDYPFAEAEQQLYDLLLFSYKNKRYLFNYSSTVVSTLTNINLLYLLSSEYLDDPESNKSLLFNEAKKGLNQTTLVILMAHLFAEINQSIDKNIFLFDSIAKTEPWLTIEVGFLAYRISIIMELFFNNSSSICKPDYVTLMKILQDSKSQHDCLKFLSPHMQQIYY